MEDNPRKLTSEHLNVKNPAEARPLPGRAAPLRLELPWLLGVLAGQVGLVVRGHAFTPMAFPAGHDWFEYLGDAWMAVHRVDLGFHAYRSALYPWAVGTLGEWLGSSPVDTSHFARSPRVGASSSRGVRGRGRSATRSGSSS